MTLSQNILLEQLRDNAFELSNVTSTNLASIYTDSVFLMASLTFIEEEMWLLKKSQVCSQEKRSFEEFLNPLFENVLEGIQYVAPLIIHNGASKLKSSMKKSDLLVKLILKTISERSSEEVKLFLIQSLQNMSLLFIAEEQLKERRKIEDSKINRGPRLYRSFDELDELLGLQYIEENLGDKGDVSSERLYSGGGVGVQSGYSTILLALNELNLEPKTSIVDLGSGFGRVGLVSALLWPQTYSIGLEFVPERVALANESCRYFKLEESLSFEAQDLSLECYKIPEADIYYLYDPFTEDTYKYILDQIIKVSEKKNITIISKGNSGKKFFKLAKEHSWKAPRILDGGNLCVFYTEKSE